MGPHPAGPDRQISHAFGLEIDKDVVRRILANHALPKSGGSDPSWLSAIAEARYRLWSVDLIRCESILLKSFWVMVVMDAARLQVNRQISITSHGDRTVPDSPTRPLPRD